MTFGISAAHDGGNIRVVGARPDGFDLEIAADAQSEFYQWFSFRLTGAAEQPVTLRIVNCAGSAYPNGWPGYRACMSADRDEWLRVPTTYEDGVLTIRITPPSVRVSRSFMPMITWFTSTACSRRSRWRLKLRSLCVSEAPRSAA